MATHPLPIDLLTTATTGEEERSIVADAWRSVSDIVTVATLANKGLALLTTRDVAAGECLLEDRPLLRLQSDSAGRYDGVYGGPRPQMRALLATLSDAKPGAGDLGAVIETNGIVINHGQPDAFTAVHLRISRCNHSCLPNAKFSFDAALGVGRLHALRPIAAGTEVSFNYGAKGGRARRQRRLLQRFNFVCGCELCSLAGDALSASDAEEEARLWGAVVASDDDESEEGASEEEGEEGGSEEEGEGVVERVDAMPFPAFLAAAKATPNVETLLVNSERVARLGDPILQEMVDASEPAEELLDG